MFYNINMKKHKHLALTITLSSIGALLLVSTSAFFIYVNDYYHTTSYALTYLESDEKTEVTQYNDYITFTPKKNVQESGIIFYPGGKVEFTAYAPLMKKLSDSGISTVLTKAPFNLAVFNYNLADSKQDLFPNVTKWYIAGHSLGGSMAAKYLETHAVSYKGLILLGSYSTSNLSSYSNLETISFIASNDKILSMSKYEANKSNLPNLYEYTIKGGIHSYFGSYGLQKGDGIPTITYEEQTRIIISSIGAHLIRFL